MLDDSQCRLVALVIIVIDLMFESRIVRLFGIGFMLVIAGCGPKDKEESQGSVVAGEGGIIGDETSGLVYRVGESIPYTGKAVWYFPSGAIRQETIFQEGRLHGIERWWHEGGARAGQCEYSSGLLNGVFVQWFNESDQKEYQVTYKNGKKDGIESEWYPGGREKSRVQYLEGIRHGMARGWYPSGNIEWAARWEMDELEGKNTEWYPSGGVRFEKNYKKGFKDGLEVHWYESGGKSWETKWVNGLEEGIRSEWYESGEKLMEVFFVNGMRKGISNGWYENGVKALEVEYLGGKAIIEKKWDEKGGALPADARPYGRVRQWSAGQIEMLFSGKPEHLVYTAFGDPDEVAAGKWRIKKVKVDSLEKTVSFTFEKGLVLSVGVE